MSDIPFAAFRVIEATAELPLVRTAESPKGGHSGSPMHSDYEKARGTR